jgi:alcohol dehydrogenase (cytochrome c)
MKAASTPPPAAVRVDADHESRSARRIEDPTRWLSYSGDYSGQRHSPLTQITPENVDRLTAQWTFQTGRARQLSDDADRGRRRALRHRLQQQRVGDRRALGPADLAVSPRAARRLKLCCRRVNRGFAILGDRLFMSTADAHLLALDIKTGGVLWDVVLEDYKAGYSATVHRSSSRTRSSSALPAPSTASAGSSTPSMCRPGKKAWRFYTVGRTD